MMPGALVPTLALLFVASGPYATYRGTYTNTQNKRHDLSPVLSYIHENNRIYTTKMEQTCKPIGRSKFTLPSMGLPRASTTRPSSPSPTGTSTMAPVLFTISPSLISLSLPKTTIPTLSGSKFRAIPYNRNNESQVRIIIDSKELSSAYLKAAGEFNHFLCLDVLKAKNSSNPISDCQHTAGLFQLGFVSKTQDPLLQDGGNLCNAGVSS